VPANIGYAGLFGLVLGESAGVPLPGETALIAAGLLAGSGQVALPAVIAVAAAAAVLGDNIGFWVGRRGGRRAILAPRGPFKRHRHALMIRGEAFFERHGPKAVFFGRWVTGVRVVAAVVAGASAMRWRTFLLYNALGAAAWAASVAGVAALLGPLAAGILYTAGLLAAGGGTALAAWRAWRGRVRARAALPSASA
jgi:membrane-associated protein